MIKYSHEMQMHRTNLMSINELLNLRVVGAGECVVGGIVVNGLAGDVKAETALL